MRATALVPGPPAGSLAVPPPWSQSMSSPPTPKDAPGKASGTKSDEVELVGAMAATPGEATARQASSAAPVDHDEDLDEEVAALVDDDEAEDLITFTARE